MYTHRDIPEKASDNGSRVKLDIPDHELEQDFDDYTRSEILRLTRDGHADLIQLMNQSHSDLLEELESIRTKYVADMNKLVNEYTATYQWLMEHIKIAISESRVMELNVVGRNESGYAKKPTRETWLEHNRGKKTVIDFIFQQLRAKGWSPVLGDISTVNYDSDDGWYSGGDRITITCDFTTPKKKK